MIEISKVSKYIQFNLDKLGIYRMDDKEYLKILYEIVMGKRLELDNPQTFNEKLQWLKLYDRNDEYTKMVDKYEVKKYVEDKIGKQYIIPTLGVWDRFEDIDFDKLPNKFVLKYTHDSGGVVICKDKNLFDRKLAQKKINKNLKEKFFWQSREWPYKNVKPRIIAEEFLENKSKEEIVDYKYYCFDGKPKVLDVCSNRSKKLNESYFDCDWNKIDVTEGGSERDDNLKKPENLELMNEIAAKLSTGIPTARIDLYNIDGKIYFSEITLYSAGGFEKFTPEEFDLKLGKYIDISKVKPKSVC